MIPLCLAWNSNTHRFLSQAVLIENFPNCMNEIKNGSTYPDSAIKDFVNHHCSDNTEDCKARIKAEEWLIKNFSTQCEHAFNLAVASHYLADSYCPAHWYSLDDCHSKFENCVDANIMAGRTCWKCSFDCKDKEGIERNLLANKSYLLQTANNIALKLNLSGPFKDTREDCKFSFLEKMIDFVSSLFKLL